MSLIKCSIGFSLFALCNNSFLFFSFPSFGFWLQINLPKDLPNELLYGRAGFLWACSFLNKNIGRDTISSNRTVRPCENFDVFLTAIFFEFRWSDHFSLSISSVEACCR